MFKRNLLIIASSMLLLLSGCTNKKLLDEIAEIKQRLEALEKIVLPPKPEVQQSAYVLPVGHSYVLGKQDAKVNIVVFTNFQCPYCARADVALRKVLQDDELKDKVNLVFKHFPFPRHEMARPASKAALAAGEQGSQKFWEMAEIIFAHQKELNNENIQKWAAKIGLDMTKFNADLKNNDQKYDAQINEDIKLGTETALLKGTPWIVVGGWFFEEDLDATNIKNLIKAKNL